MKLFREDLLVNNFKCIYGEFFDIYCQSKNRADFHILQGKLDVTEIALHSRARLSALYICVTM